MYGKTELFRRLVDFQFARKSNAEGRIGREKRKRRERGVSREGEEEEERERESYQLHGVRDLNAAIGHGLDHDPHVFE